MRKKILKVKQMQKSGTEAIRTQLQPSKSKREITKITNSQNTKKHVVKRLSSSFPKGGHSAIENHNKNNALERSEIINSNDTELYSNLKVNSIDHFRCMCLVVRKPAFCICENKDGDQLGSNCTAD